MTRGGKYYFITFIDDCSRYTYVYLLRTKDKDLSKFKIYVIEVENKLNRKVIKSRSDRGGEYTSKDFLNLCEFEGNKRTSIGLYTPQQNGTGERENCTLIVCWFHPVAKEICGEKLCWLLVIS